MTNDNPANAALTAIGLIRTATLDNDLASRFRTHEIILPADDPDARDVAVQAAEIAAHILREAAQDSTAASEYLDDLTAMYAGLTPPEVPE